MATKISKHYLEQHYDLAISNFKLARNEEEQWKARKDMADLERCAAVMYGLNYADELAKRKKPLMVKNE